LIDGRNMLRLIRSLIRDDAGATAIEYGLLAALVAVVIVSALSAVGGKLKTTYSTVAGSI
jgi:pilus assembly protein Flp/PilA